MCVLPLLAFGFGASLSQRFDVSLGLGHASFRGLGAQGAGSRGAAQSGGQRTCKALRHSAIAFRIAGDRGRWGPRFRPRDDWELEPVARWAWKSFAICA